MADTARRSTYINMTGLYSGDCVLCKLPTEAEETADLNNKNLIDSKSVAKTRRNLTGILTLRKPQKCHVVRTFS